MKVDAEELHNNLNLSWIQMMESHDIAFLRHSVESTVVDYATEFGTKSGGIVAARARSEPGRHIYVKHLRRTVVRRIKTMHLREFRGCLLLMFVQDRFVQDRQTIGRGLIGGPAGGAGGS